jgi:phosphotransferase system enzyme I (PtsI)
MVSSVEELDAALDVLDEAREECARDGSRFNPEMKVGVMVEIPSAAVCADLLAKRPTSSRSGPNDLIQYTMAVDRENAKVAHLFDQYSPAILRLVKPHDRRGQGRRIEVSLCGEMRATPEATVLLLGLGLRSFSMDAGRLPSVREVAGRGNDRRRRGARIRGALAFGGA